MIIYVFILVGILCFVVNAYKKQQEYKLDQFLELKEYRDSRIRELIENMYQSCFVKAWNDWVNASRSLSNSKRFGDQEKIKREEKMVQFHETRKQELLKIRKRLEDSMNLEWPNSPVWKDKYNVKDSNLIRAVILDEYSKSVTTAQEIVFR